MYKPKLTYVFCLMRKRSLMPALSVMRYMNSVGLIPQLLINNTEFGGGNHFIEIQKELDRYNIKYSAIKELHGRNHDVLFSEGMGTFCPFEKRQLKQSRELGKTNVVLVNSLSGWRNDVNVAFVPEKTKLIDGVCMKIEEHLLYFKEFTKDLFLINTGDPDWDWWRTDEFINEVEKTKAKFGDKILVFCDVFISPEQSVPFVECCIKQAESSGFKFMINPHPDRWDMIPSRFHKYCNTEIHHHVLFKAASHLISHISSSVIFEGLLLGTKVGADPTIAHCDGWGKHRWLNKDLFCTNIVKHLKQEIIDMIPLVFNEEDVHNFLSSFEPAASVEAIGKALGKIKVPCYSEYLFQTLDKKLMKEEK